MSTPLVASLNIENEMGWWFCQNLTPSAGGRMASDILFITWSNWARALNLSPGTHTARIDWVRQQGVNIYKGTDGRHYCENYRHAFPRPLPSLCP